MDIIQTIAEIAPNIEIIILISKEHVNKKTRGKSIEEVFSETWDEICEGAPPKTEIVVIGFGPEGKHPIHDRWIVSDHSGLRLGTSTSSIGHVRISEISLMDRRAAAEKKGVIATVLDRETRHWDGQKLHRARFTL